MSIVSGRPWRRLAIAAALVISARAAAADEPAPEALAPGAPAPAALAWLPLTAITGAAHAEIAAAARDTPLGPYLPDSTQVEIAMAELDEDPGDAPLPDRQEILLRLARDACAGRDCPVTILTRRDGRLVELGSFRGGEIALAAGFSQGLRYLALGDTRLWFDGRDFRRSWAPEGWKMLAEIDPADRAWIEEKLGIGMELVPEPNPPEDDDVIVTYVDLDEAAPAATARPELIVYVENGWSCGSRGCTFDVYALDGDRPRPLGGMLGSFLRVGPEYHNGKRDLILDGRGLFTFDGESYNWTATLPVRP